MTSPTTIRTKVISLIEPAVIAAGYELVDVRFVSEQGGWVLRVYVAHPPADPSVLAIDAGVGRPIDIGDCERLSRELSTVLDVSDPITQAYSLEVSSPGIDRPLRTAGHFARYQGAEIKLTLDRALPLESGGERRNFRGFVSGVEGTGDATMIVLDVDGQAFRLRLADVDTAKVAPDWDDVMRGGPGLRRRGGPADAVPWPRPAARPRPRARARARARPRPAASALSPDSRSTPPTPSAVTAPRRILTAPWRDPPWIAPSSR